MKVCELAGVAPGEVDAVFHGTTVATNMVIERNGAEVGMITTRGFRDICTWRGTSGRTISRCSSTCRGSPSRWCKRRNRIAVTERIMPPTGEIEIAAGRGRGAGGRRAVRKRGMNAVIICFLFSFLNDAHEQRAKEIVER